jgi:hypothetical protein
MTKYNLQDPGDLTTVVNRDHLEMLKRPHLWPIGWCLPMKRRKDGRKELGVVLKVRPLRVYATPHGYIGTDYKSTSFVDYDSLKAIVAAGWEVD